MKTFIYTGLFIGSVIGGWLPTLWGAGYVSLSSVLFSAIGSLIGVLAGYRLAQMYL